MLRILPEATEAVKQIKEYGVPGWYGHSLPCVASMAAIPGDYLEIGAYHGASAIAVGLTKKQLGLPGKIVCVDPLKVDDPQYPVNDLRDYHRLTPEVILKNAEHFGIEIELITKPSFPWPEELHGRTFSAAYVDGDHRYPHPGIDLSIVVNIVTTYIGIDDVEAHSQQVWGPILNLLESRTDWWLEYKNDGFLVLTRQVYRPVRFGVSAMVDFTFDYTQISSKKSS